MCGRWLSPPLFTCPGSLAPRSGGVTCTQPRILDIRRGCEVGTDAPVSALVMSCAEGPERELPAQDNPTSMPQTAAEPIPPEAVTRITKPAIGLSVARCPERYC